MDNIRLPLLNPTQSPSLKKSEYYPISFNKRGIGTMAHRVHPILKKRK